MFIRIIFRCRDTTEKARPTSTFQRLLFVFFISHHYSLIR